MDKITDHIQRGKDLLIQYFKESSTVESVVKIIGTKIQECEDVLFQLLNNRSLKNAVGQQLDGIGEILGEKRLGRDDDSYRVALNIKVQINISSGTPEEVINIASALTDAEQVVLTELYPAAIHVLTYGEAPSTNVGLALVKIVPATVSLMLVIAAKGGEAFAFDGPTPGKGYGDVGFLGSAGKYAEAYDTGE